MSVAHEFAVSITPAESQFYFPLINNLDDDLNGLPMLYRSGTSPDGNYMIHDTRENLSRGGVADSTKGIEMVDLGAGGEAIYILPNELNIPPSQPSGVAGPLVPNGLTLEGQIFIENNTFNANFAISSNKHINSSPTRHFLGFSINGVGQNSMLHTITYGSYNGNQNLTVPWVLNEYLHFVFFKIT